MSRHRTQGSELPLICGQASSVARGGRDGRVRSQALTALGLLVFVLSVVPSSAHAIVRDRDKDGLTNRFERLRSHTSPRHADTDRDRLRDGFEVRRSNTNPRRRDTDGDGLGDGFELRRSLTSPRRKDTDADGIPDGIEVLAGTDPRVSDRKKWGGPRPDRTPPETSITSGPTGMVTTTSASFQFVASEAGSSFRCRVDFGTWDACASPKTYAAMAASAHEFEVRATDGAGNTDTTPATRTWSVVTPAAPVASFAWSPQNPQNPPVAVTFTSTSSCPATPCTYEWRNGPPGNEPIGTGPTASWTFQSTGTKTVVLRVTDALGRASEVTNTLSVTTSPPPPPTGPSCTTTLEPGADVSRAIQSAANGSTICLAAGNYGPLDTGADKVGVTVRPASGVANVAGIWLTGASGLTFQGLSVTPDGVLIRGSRDIVLDGNHIHDIRRLTSCPTGVDPGVGYGVFVGLNSSTRSGDITIRSNLIERVAHDGVHLGAVDGALVERNEIRNVVPQACGDHTDSMQWVDGPRRDGPAATDVHDNQHGFMVHGQNHHPPAERPDREQPDAQHRRVRLQPLFGGRAGRRE